VRKTYNWDAREEKREIFPGRETERNIYARIYNATLLLAHDNFPRERIVLIQVTFDKPIYRQSMEGPWYQWMEYNAHIVVEVENE